MIINDQQDKMAIPFWCWNSHLDWQQLLGFETHFVCSRLSCVFGHVEAIDRTAFVINSKQCSGCNTFYPYWTSCSWPRSFLYSLSFKKFLSLPNHTIRVLVTGNRMNRGAGYGLEIPVEYVFNGNEKALQWAKKNLDNIDERVNKKVGRCLIVE